MPFTKHSMGAFSAMAASIGCLSNTKDTDPPTLPSQEIRCKAFFPFLFDSKVEISSLPLTCIERERERERDIGVVGCGEEEEREEDDDATALWSSTAC